jgi:hypothetical protein
MHTGERVGGAAPALTATRFAGTRPLPLRWLAGVGMAGMGPVFRGARPHPNPSPVAMGEGLVSRNGAENRGRRGEATDDTSPCQTAMGEGVPASSTVARRDRQAGEL